MTVEELLIILHRIPHSMVKTTEVRLFLNEDIPLERLIMTNDNQLLLTTKQTRVTTSDVELV